jgi:hypothetical protein
VGFSLALPKLGMNRLEGGIEDASGLLLELLLAEGTGDLELALWGVFLGDEGKKRMRLEGLEGGTPALLSVLPMSANASLYP